MTLEEQIRAIVREELAKQTSKTPKLQDKLETGEFVKTRRFNGEYIMQEYWKYANVAVQQLPYDNNSWGVVITRSYSNKAAALEAARALINGGAKE